MSCPRIVGDYRVVGHIGSGEFGDVYEVVHERKAKKFALKAVGSAPGESLCPEAHILQQLKHPHIVQLMRIFFDEPSSKNYLVLELVEGENLEAVIRHQGPFSEAKTRRIFQQLVSAVRHCHDADIVHRDLKPTNVMIDSNGHAKIVDFGLALQIESSSENLDLSSTVGSLGTMSPQLLECTASSITTTDLYAADVWALGVILYYMITGTYPFEGRCEEETQYNILNCVCDLTKVDCLEVRELLGNIFHRDQTKRFNLSDIQLDLWHGRDMDLSLGPQHAHRLSRRSSSRTFATGEILRSGSCSPQDLSYASLSEDDDELVRLAFDRLDVDRCGYVTRDSLRDAIIFLRRDEAVENQQLEELMQFFSPQNDRVSFEEFADAWDRQETSHISVPRFADVFTLENLAHLPRTVATGETVKCVRKSFDRLDESHCGLVTKATLVDAFAKAELSLSNEDADNLIDELGTVHHAHVAGFDEFLSSIVEKGLLVRHRLGKRLSDVLGLDSVRQEQELSIAQLEGILVKGSQSRVAEKLSEVSLQLFPAENCRPARESSPEQTFTVQYRGHSCAKITLADGSVPGYTVVRCARVGCDKEMFRTCVSNIVGTLQQEREALLTDTQTTGESELI